MIWLNCLALALGAEFTNNNDFESRMNRAVQAQDPPTRYENHLKIARTGFSHWDETMCNVMKVAMPQPIPFVDLVGGLKGIGLLIVNMMESSSTPTTVVKGSDYRSLRDLVGNCLLRHHLLFCFSDDTLRPWIGLHTFLHNLVEMMVGEQEAVMKKVNEYAKEGIPLPVILYDEIKTPALEREVGNVAVKLTNPGTDEIGGILIAADPKHERHGGILYLDPQTDERFVNAEYNPPSRGLNRSQGTLWCVLDLHLGSPNKRTLAAMLIALAVEMVVELEPKLLEENQEWLQAILAKSRDYWDLLGSHIKTRITDGTDPVRLALLQGTMRQ